MKIRALKSFEGIRDNERNVYPKAGEIWEVSEKRAEFLKSHGVVEIVEEEQEEVTEKVEEVKEEPVEDVTIVCMEEKVKTTKKKKSSKK